MNYYIIYKPYKMISQFTSEHKKKCLSDLEFTFSKDVYSVGRLDENSEGLLILTNDKSLNHRLLKPEFEHKRVYLVQLQGIVTDAAIKEIEAGITIALDTGQYVTKPCKVKKVKKPENLAPRAHAPNETLPTSWIELTLTEGKYHQVRKMTAGVGFPCLRLIRVAIEDLRIENMQPGDVRELKRDAIYKRLKINLE
jgi:23S rRNA pseudouridine2457 synthase